jgi:hypothetical protein
LAVLVDVHMDAALLRPIGRPKDSRRGCPDLERQPRKLVEVDLLDDIHVAVGLAELVMKRFEGRRRDRLLAPGVVSPAVPAQVLGVGLAREIAQI